MKTVVFLHMPGCPYCTAARRALAQLRAENPAYAALAVEEIDETADPRRAAEYNYYYVPSFFVGGRKIYEAHPGDSDRTVASNVHRALDAALA